jgi:hypothetical protein
MWFAISARSDTLQSSIVYHNATGAQSHEPCHYDNRALKRLSMLLSNVSWNMLWCNSVGIALDVQCSAVVRTLVIHKHQSGQYESEIYKGLTPVSASFANKLIVLHLVSFA